MDSHYLQHLPPSKLFKLVLAHDHDLATHVANRPTRIPPQRIAYWRTQALDKLHEVTEAPLVREMSRHARRYCKLATAPITHQKTQKSIKQVIVTAAEQAISHYPQTELSELLLDMGIDITPQAVRSRIMTVLTAALYDRLTLPRRSKRTRTVEDVESFEDFTF